MAQIDNIIEPERHGLWIAVTFIIALLALGMVVVQQYRTSQIAVATQLEVLKLNQKIEKAQKAVAAPPAAPAAAQPQAK
jgi:hypothetical protein